jgi:hypothetical protein
MTSPPRWLLGATSDSAFRAPTVDGVQQGVNPTTGSVASAIWVNQPPRGRALAFNAIDGESCGDHAFSGLERDPYTDDGGES